MNQQIEVPGVGIVEFPEGMSDSDITKAITTQIIPNYSRSDSTLKSFGRSAASLADTAIDSVTGALDAAAYPLARAFGRSPDQAQQETTSPKNVIGRAFGVQNTPEYNQEASRQVMEYIATHMSEGADVIAAKTGLPKQDVENMMNTILAGVSPAGARAAHRVGGAVADAGRAVAAVPGQVAKGALNAVKSDTPVASRVVPEPVIQQATSPVVPAPGSGATPRPADIGPIGETVIRMGRGDVPVKGRGVEAATETALRGWKDALSGNYLGKGGIQTAADIAGLMGVGIPFQGSMIRGAVPLAKSMSPIKAVDVPLGEGRTVPGFQRPSGGTYISAEDMRNSGHTGTPRPVAPVSETSASAAKTEPVAPVSETSASAAKTEPVAPAFKSAGEKSGSTYREDIETELANRIKADPGLERYNKDYVIPEHNQHSLDQFLNGQSKSTLVHGGPGTGKTALAGEWMAKNGGEMEYINVKDFSAKQAQALQERLDVSQKPVLLLVDEADQLTKAQVQLVNDLTQHPNARALYTSNNLAKVSDSIKNQSNTVQMNVTMTPEQKAVFGLGRAVRGEMFGKPASEVVAAAHKGTSFRDIKRGVPELTGQTDMSAVKREPMFGTEHAPIDSTPRVQQVLDDLENNRSPKNVVIIDKSVYAVDPEFGAKLNVYAQPRDINIAGMLANPTTASPLVRIAVTDSESASKISALKGLIERNNETNNPTNIIIEDKFGKLDPAIHSRATVITAKDIQKPAGPAPVAPKKSGGDSFNSELPIGERDSKIYIDTPGPLVQQISGMVMTHEPFKLNNATEMYAWKDKIKSENHPTIDQVLSVSRQHLPTSELQMFSELVENRLKELGTPSTVIRMKQSKERPQSNGSYNLGGNVTILRDSFFKFNDTYASQVVLHEAIHNLTLEAYKKDAMFRERIDDIFGDTNSLSDRTDLYGFSKPQEFLSEIFSNPEFMDEIRSIHSDSENLGNIPKGVVVEGLTDSLRAKVSAILKTISEYISGILGKPGSAKLRSNPLYNQTDIIHNLLDDVLTSARKVSEYQFEGINHHKVSGGPAPVAPKK
jgi:hypothetical protein